MYRLGMWWISNGQRVVDKPESNQYASLEQAVRAARAVIEAQQDVEEADRFTQIDVERDGAVVASYDLAQQK